MPANTIGEVIGGGAANTACALGRLGRAVNLIGIIGMSDADWFEARLLEFGVGSKGIYRAEGNTGVTASVSMVDDRSFFFYLCWREREADGYSSLYRHGCLQIEGVRAMCTLHCHLIVNSLKNYSPALPEKAGCTTSLDVGFSTSVADLSSQSRYLSRYRLFPA